jgi:hypothetical protein
LFNIEDHRFVKIEIPFSKLIFRETKLSSNLTSLLKHTIMSDWGDIIGKFNNINGNGNIIKHIWITMYNTIVFHKDELHKEGVKETVDLKMFETYQQYHTPKEKGSKYTYFGKKITKDKTTNKRVEIECDQPVKKFANITVEVKYAFMFLLNRYIYECNKCFVESKCKLKSPDKVLDQVDEYARKNILLPITPFLIKVYEMYKIEHLLEPSWKNHCEEFNKKISGYFKDRDDVCPKDSVNKLVEVFVKFIKVISLMICDILYAGRKAVNGPLFYGCLGTLNTMCNTQDYPIESEMISNMIEYVENNKPPPVKKAKKSKSGSESEADGTDEEDEEEPKKKPKAKKAAKKPKKPSKKDEAVKKPKKVEDDDAMADEIDIAMKGQDIDDSGSE